jgi:hypothetical protein
MWQHIYEIITRNSIFISTKRISLCEKKSIHNMSWTLPLHSIFYAHVTEITGMLCTSDAIERLVTSCGHNEQAMLYFSLSLSLSLSLMHTHTHTHTQNNNNNKYKDTQKMQTNTWDATTVPRCIQAHIINKVMFNIRRGATIHVLLISNF